MCQRNMKWVPEKDGRIPPGAFHGGRDLDGDLYVGRAQYNTEIIPGKVNPNHGVCYISWGGKEMTMREYEVLVGENFAWIPNRGGNIPFAGVPVSDETHGEVLYIGRVHYDGTKTIGKVHPSHGVCYIPFGGKEISHEEYEILVTKC